MQISPKNNTLEKRSNVAVARIVVSDIVVCFELNKHELVCDDGASNAQHESPGEKEKLFARKCHNVVIHLLGEPFYLQSKKRLKTKLYFW